MSTRTKAELLAESERLQRRVAELERAKARSEAAPKEIEKLRADLLESEQQQTATAEILRIISSSRSDAQPVFDAVAESAARLCGAQDVVIRLVEGDKHCAVAHHGPIPVLPPHVVTRANPGGRAIIDARTVHIPDVSEAHVREEYPETRRAGGQRTFLAVPLLRESKAIGLIVVRRLEVRPFADKQIKLLETFAAQAVIAIENVWLFNETKEALERQTASSEILASISGSISDTKPVFDAIVNNVLRLFGTPMTAVFMLHGDQLDLASLKGEPFYDAHFRNAFPQPVNPHTLTGRVLLSGQAGQLAPVIGNPEATEESVALARKYDFNSMIVAPMVGNGKVIGAIATARREAIRFDDKQVALLKTFADQAVIAIENVRLFKELQARNVEITEALEQQTATAEVLKVISRSAFDLDAVLQTLMDNAARLCRAHRGVLFRRDEDVYRVATMYNGTPELLEYLQSHPVAADRRTVTGRSVAERRPMHVHDVLTDVEYEWRDAARLGSYRTVLSVPLLREGEPMGSIALTRDVVEPFSAQEMALVTTFADQAVIAIENVRLFQALAARNADISEALEQQTATSEILRVISSSPTDTQPVFDAILENATRLCDAHSAALRLYDGGYFRNVAQRGISAEYARWIAEEAHKYPMHPDGGPYASVGTGRIGRLLADGQPAHILDRRESPSYRAGNPFTIALVELEGVRTFLAVPMLKEGQVIGAIVVHRREVRAFTQKQVELLSTFADQAVIAIENARLFKELEARTDSLARSVAQLTALSEVGQAISSTLDLETVLKTIAARAIELSGQDACVIYEYDPATEGFELRAAQNFDAQSAAALRRAASRVRKGEGAVGTCVVTRAPTQVPDTHVPEYPARLREILDLAGFRAVLAVPLLREDQIIGALMLIRKTPGPFSAEVVRLLETFASQSALAIQNARLFREIADKGRQLEVASRHKSDFLASMSHELRTPLNAILGFIELILDQIYGEVPTDLQEPLADIQASGKHLLRLINNVLDLAKIEAGRMELALTEYSVQDTVESVRQTLKPLAADKGLEFLATVPPDLPFAHGDPGRITQCLMNLAGNSLKFTKAGKVEISVERQGERLVFRVADTGIGIAPDKIASLFTEFKQTDATIAGEYGGTGLGLSISRKFVEMHGGRIWVESEPDRGSTFVFEVPLRAGEPT